MLDEQPRTLPIYRDSDITHVLTFSKHSNRCDGDLDAERNEENADDRKYLKEQRTMGLSQHVDCEGFRLAASKNVDLDRPLIFQLLEHGDKHSGITQIDPIDPLQYIA